MRTPDFNSGKVFLEQGAGKHFVGMTFDATAPGKSERVHQVRSAFVIEASDAWFVVTAGHVIAEIRDAMNAGYRLDRFALQDRSAGNNFGLGVPIPFDVDEWVLFEGDPHGTDYAVWGLPELVIKNLERGGVKALGAHAWKMPTENDDSLWALVGAPAEGVGRSPTGARQFKLVVLPLERCPPPENALNVQNRLFAKIRDSDDGEHAVSDVSGMSGGPVYELEIKDGEITWWVIGVQSSWFQTQRKISFCPVGEFFDAVVDAVEQVRERLRRGGPADNNLREDT